MKKVLLSILLFMFLADTTQADEYIYTYCMVKIDTLPELAGQLAILSFNLSDAEITLTLKNNGEYRQLARRKPQVDSGLSVNGSLDELNMALQLRENVSRGDYFRTSSETGVMGLDTDNPLPCQADISPH